MKEFINFNSKEISWFRCGGKILVYCIVDNLNKLQFVLEKYEKYKNNILIIGAGSNSLIRDKGFDGLVIKLSGEFNNLKIKQHETENDIILLTAGAAVFDKKVVDFAIENRLIGCEFLDTIPGTIGGAVKMNAGCFDKEIKDILFSTKLFINGKEEVLTEKDFLSFSYRKSSIPENAIILEATFKLKKGTQNQLEESKNMILEMRKKRKENQIVGFTCGSTFKNPISNDGKKISVWKLIDEVGLRGFSIGGAKFSEKHCNFLINYNNANATDIENLILLAKQKVKDKFNIELEEEIKIFGNM